MPKYWGKGIATEVSKEIIKYGFEILNLEKIIGIALSKNIGSCKVLEKIGLELYKIVTYDKDDAIKYNWYVLEKEKYKRLHSKQL